MVSNGVLGLIVLNIGALNKIGVLCSWGKGSVQPMVVVEPDGLIVC